MSKEAISALILLLGNIPFIYIVYLVVWQKNRTPLKGKIIFSIPMAIFLSVIDASMIMRLLNI